MADDSAAERPVSSRRRTAVAYIDGFNFYYGAVRQHPDLKWLDLEVLCERLLGRGYELLGVTYCTARVSATVTDPQAPERQQRFLRALSGLSRTKVLTGTFLTKTITRPIARGSRKGKRVEVVTWEEKGSDVNIATELVLDTCDGRMTTALIISNDSDLQHTVDVVRGRNVEVIVVDPHHRSHARPSLIGSDTRRLTRRHLVRSQLPNPAQDGQGRLVYRPATWA